MSETPPISTGLGVSLPTPPRQTSQAQHHRAGAKVKAFAVIDRPAGSIIWGTVRHDAAEAWAIYERHNPSVSGYANPAQLVELELTIREIPPLFAARIAPERG